MVEAKEDLKSHMIYRYLGNTGIRVSALGYGNYLNSDSPESQAFTTASLKRCIEHGVNFIDTAEGYGTGNAEIMLGNSIKELGLKRESIVVSTKLYKKTFFDKDPDHIKVNNGGLSRKHIIEGAKNSLKRLQLTYVDVIYAHRPDLTTPLEETCRAFSWLIDKNLAFYWGTSEWTAQRITQAIELCKKLGLHAPIVEQPQYNMFVRERFEKEYRPIFEEFGYGTTTWGPVCGGILSGKFNDGNLPQDSRFAKDPYQSVNVWPKYFGPENKEKTLKKLNALAGVAKELGCTQAALALAWGLANKDVSTQLLGFTKLEQIDENMKCLEAYKKWTPEIEAKCEAILGNGVDIDMNFRDMGPYPQRRIVAMNKQ